MISTYSRMTKEELKRELDAMDRAAKKIFKSKKSTREFLIKHGYMTKGGKLPKRYGG